MSTRTLLTADELEQMPDDDSVQIELDEAELITMPPAGGEHGYREMEFGSILRTFVKKNKLGRVYTGDTGFRLNDNTVRSPDVAFVSAKRVPAVHSSGFCKGAPDLAVEIRSLRIISPAHAESEAVPRGWYPHGMGIRPGSARSGRV